MPANRWIRRAGPGCDDHDVTIAALEHLRQHQLREDDRRHHVRLEMQVEQLHRGVEQLIHVPGADVATVVDEHVDASPGRQHRVDSGFQRRTVGEVHHDLQRAPSLCLDQRRGLVE
jgi:hypothetical protein